MSVCISARARIHSLASSSSSSSAAAAVVVVLAIVHDA